MSQSSAVDEGRSGATDTSTLDADERRELDRLRQEVATLRAGPAPGRRRIRWASLAAGDPRLMKMRLELCAQTFSSCAR